MRLFGPPIPGAPWMRPELRPHESSPAPYSIARPSNDKIYVVRVPDAQGRLRRHTELVADILNSLIRQGYIYLDDQRVYKVAGGSIVGSGAPTVDTDAAIGAFRGCIYVDEDSDDVYVCGNATIGEAVWRGPI